MLTKRIIPCLDVDKGKVVKGKSFINLVDAGDPVELAKKYYDSGADEIVFLDITASIENRETILSIVEKVSKNVFIPLTVGGGIKVIEDIKKLLNSGADKVSINTSGILNRNFINEASNYFGSQAIVGAIDAKKNGNSWEIYSHGGRKPTGLDALQWAKTLEKLGAGELLVTSIDQDGKTSGYDIDLLQEITNNVNIPIIASGGAGSPEHMYKALAEGKADAVLAASIFHFEEYTIKNIKQYLNSKGIKIRND
ncbi:MAG: imidazole glycerol phosphate synthase subunit HisF [Chloroflexi bacterium]|nr:imidazole glycerol phosphate synthase subunit HisF [Chloroflexota bacterium]|tara:strand:- start:322 stop:1080 length:759 start_codon:yes stop_codon:yes gene_type:complete